MTLQKHCQLTIIPVASVAKPISDGKKTVWFVTRTTSKPTTKTITAAKTEPSPVVVAIDVQHEECIVITTDYKRDALTEEEISTLFQNTSTHDVILNIFRLIKRYYKSIYSFIRQLYPLGKLEQ